MVLKDNDELLPSQWWDRARPRSIQIIRTGIVDPKDLKRPATQQFAAKGLKFPLPHRIMRPSQKKFRATFVANRPCTHFQ